MDVFRPITDFVINQTGLAATRFSHAGFTEDSLDRCNALIFTGGTTDFYVLLRNVTSLQVVSRATTRQEALEDAEAIYNILHYNNKDAIYCVVSISYAR